MRLAIMLITSNRADYTERTLESFRLHNGWCAHAQMDVFHVHGDDVSDDDRNHELARKYAFTSILTTRSRRGAHGFRRSMIETTMEYCNPDLIMILENDWISVRPIPFATVCCAFEKYGVWAFRLYGEQKQQDGTRPAGAEHAGRNNADPHWKNFTLHGEEVQLGDIHFGAPPCIFTPEELRFLHQGTRSDSQAMRRSGKIKKKTMRVVENVFWHIGDNRTPGFTR